MTRVVITSGDPATGVITIEAAPMVERWTPYEQRDHNDSRTWIQRVPLSLPATVEVVAVAAALARLNLPGADDLSDAQADTLIRYARRLAVACGVR